MMTYFITFILIGSFFFLNFFIGVLFLKYNEAQKEEQRGLTKADMGWMDIQKLILSSEPDYETTNIPSQPWRKYFHDLVVSTQFEASIMICIVLNMFQMALSHENQEPYWTYYQGIANNMFAIIYALEASFKLVAFGKSYFSNGWNRFDFIVVMTAIMDSVLKMFADKDDSNFLRLGPQIDSVLRVMRITRVIKLANQDDGLKAIIETIMFSILSLANVFVLLLIVFFMFSILGVTAFNEVNRGDVIDEHKNFRNFGHAFLLLFAVSTGEDWNRIMFDCSRTPQEGCIEGETCGAAPYSYWYFYIMVLTCSHVMLNLFILVIIQQFEKYYLPKENMISLFKTDQMAFMKVWKKFTM